MNVGIFCPTINSVGGGELVALNMIHALEKRNHKITIFSSKNIDLERIKSFLGDDLKIDNEVVMKPNFSNPYSLENIYPNLLKSFLFKYKCDFIIDTFSDAVYPWINAVYFQKDPRIDRLPKSLKGKLFVPYKTFLKSSCSKHNQETKVLMTCSEFTAKNISASIGQPVNVLYPPVSKIFRRKGDSSKDNTVVTVTRISNDKRPESIPQIASLVADNLSFIIVGSCRLPNELQVLRSLREYIRKLGLEKRVKLLINISRERQIAILQRSKVYLHPSVPYEAFGISVAEAMSAGCVPVVPDIGGLREIVLLQLRYENLTEAASLVTESIENWSSSKARDSE